MVIVGLFFVFLFFLSTVLCVALRIAYCIRSTFVFVCCRSVDEAENNLRNMSEEDGRLPGILIN